MQMPRMEYPRPQFVREEWLCLNGTWQFAFDDQNIGIEQRWFENASPFDRTITVPYAFQSSLSGIGDTSFHDCVWYRRELEIPPGWRGKKILLHFGAVDYEAIVYLNGKQAGFHAGGHVGFTVDLTPWLTYQNDVLTVRVFDPSTDETIPRGKQFWQEQSAVIWYTRTTGIWQSVWMEPVEEAHIQEIRMTPDVDNGEIGIEASIAGWREGLSLRYTIDFQGGRIVQDTVQSAHPVFVRRVDVFQQKILRTSFHKTIQGCWSPENPLLYDITYELLDGDAVLDRAESYFGMRKVHTEHGMVYLNNRPYYQKLVLDQGYWPEGLLTAPTDEDFIRDIELAKAMGFNGCRKHQKVEDPRFLYWADKMGFLVWGEMPGGISYSHNYVERMTAEWLEVLRRDYNHPSIVVWVPLNESWAIPNVSRNVMQKSHCSAMYYLTKSMDGTRPVVSNDGWEMTISDICSVHDYNHGNRDQPEKHRLFAETLRTRENMLQNRASGKALYADGFQHRGEPILLTEFGGVHYAGSDGKGWGYSSAESEDDYLEALERIFRAVYQSECIYGLCYTQLADVEQETNGLLQYDRSPKCDLEKIRAIVENQTLRTPR